jgi:hypothetical protein
MNKVAETALVALLVCGLALYGAYAAAEAIASSMDNTANMIAEASNG